MVGGPNLSAYFPLRRDPMGYFTRIARENGDIVGIRIGPRVFYLVSHPREIEVVLISGQRRFVKGRGLKFTASVLGNGLLTSDGALWQRQRRLAQPAFHKNRVEQYGNTMVACALARVSAWKNGERYDIAAEMAEIALTVAAQTLFSVALDSRADTFRRDVTTVMRTVNRRVRALIPVPDWIPTPRMRAYSRALAELDAVIYRVIADRRRQGEASGDLLSLLMAARDEAGAPMSDRQLRDEAMTLLIAGHETTANALAWTWYLLACHPEVRDKLSLEWQSTLNGADPRVTDLASMPYTEAVITESLRLYPPAWMIPRQAGEDLELGGHFFPKGSQFVLSQWVVHRDPRFFIHPDRFWPERWLDREAGRNIPAMAYFPFGGGPRLCIGRSFALMELALILPAIGQRVSLELLEGTRVEPEPLIGLRPKNGLSMRVRTAGART